MSYSVEMDAEAQALKVVSPEFDNLSPNRDHCLSLEITIWLPPSATFENILIEATELSIRLMDDVDFNVSQESRFATYAGDVHFPTTNLSTVQGLKKDDEHRSTPLHGDTEDNFVGRVQPDSSDLDFTSNVPSNPSQGLHLKGAEYATPRKLPPGFSSREIVVRTISGDITGFFYLYDLLDLETDSGGVDISVAPQPDLHEGGPHAAQLTVATASGDIQCRYPIWNSTNIPDRDYRTSVTTHSGRISGDYVIGTEAMFRAISGDFDITALPTTDEKSTFSTDTTSGSTRVTVLQPLSRHRTALPLPTDNIDIGDDDPYVIIRPPEIVPIDTDAPITQSKIYRRPLTHITSFHECSSGDMKIHYPSAWEGEINAVTISGNIRVGGDGVRTIKDSRKNWAYREVIARKGPAAEYASVLKVHGVSGNLDVWVGENCLNSEWCKMEAI
jgi:hypothetical protein